MRLRHLLSLAVCHLALGCSVYDASLQSHLAGQAGAVQSTTGGRAGEAGAKVGAGGDAGSYGLGDATSVVSGSGGAGAPAGAGGAGGASDGGPDVPVGEPDANLESGPAPSDASCLPEGTISFCLRHAKDCGDVTDVDNCGSTVTINCGVCGSRLVCGAQGPNRCGTAVSLAHGGTVFSSNPNVRPEDMTSAFDGQTSTKWYAGDYVPTASIGYDFGSGNTHVVSSYAITSANDMAGRDPSAWQFQGSNDGTTFTTLDTQSAQTFTSRLQTSRYACTAGGPYRKYRLNVTANSGSTSLQLAEIQLFGY